MRRADRDGLSSWEPLTQRWAFPFMRPGPISMCERDTEQENPGDVSTIAPEGIREAIIGEVWTWRLGEPLAGRSHRDRPSAVWSPFLCIRESAPASLTWSDSLLRSST